MTSKVRIIITATDKASGPLKGIGSNLQGLGKAAIIGGLGAAAVGVAALGGAMVKLAIDAEPVEGIQKGFEGLTQSIEGGSQAMLQAMVDTSSGLITNTDLMESFNKASQLVGTTFAETLPDAMGPVGKVAAATGQDMGFLLDSLVTGVGRLSPMILDNLGIQVSLTEANQAYADKIGVVASELTKEQQQLALTDQVMEKLAKNTANMPDPSGNFQQLTVKLQNLKDTIGVALIPVMAPLFEMLGNIASVVGDKLIGLIENLKLPLQFLGDAFQDLMAGDLEGFFGNLRVAVFSLFQSLGAGEETLAAIRTIFDEIKRSMEAGLTPFETLMEVLDNFLPEETINAIWEIHDGIMQLKDQVMEFLEPIIQWIEENVKLQDILTVVAIAIMSVVIPAIISLVTSLAPILLAIGAAILIVALLRKAWEENFLGIQDKVQVVIEFIRNLIESVMNWIRDFWEENGEAIKAKAMEIWTAIQTAVNNAITFVRDLIETVMTWIREFWAEHGEAILQTASDIWTAIQDAIQFAVDYIKTYVGAFMLLFEGDWRGFGEQLREAWNMIWDKIVEFVEAAIPRIIEFVSQLILDIIAWFQNTDWGAVGDNIIQGILGGLQSAGGAIISFIVGLANNALDAIKGFFGIESPSKVMAEVGENIVAGLIQGLDNGLSDVEDSVAGINGALSGDSVLTGSVTGAQGLLNGPTSGGVHNSTHYHLNTNSVQSGGDILQDFELMRAMTI